MIRPLTVLVFLFLAPLGRGWAQSAFTLSDLKPRVIQIHRVKEAGLIDGVEVKLGDAVVEGQMLVRLEDDRQLHAYNVAKVRADNRAAVTIAEGELQDKSAVLEDLNMKYRRRQVSASQVAQGEGQVKAAEGRLDQARMNAKLGELELELARKMLERRYVRSALKGTVIEIAKAPGDRVGEGDAVVTVADLDWMTAMIPLTKESAAILTEGATFPVKVAGTSLTQLAQVIAITPMPNAPKGEQLVQIAFSNSDPLSVLKLKAFEVLLPQNIKAAPVAKPAPAPPKTEPAKKPGHT